MNIDQYLATTGQTVKNHPRRFRFGLLAFVLAAILSIPTAASAQTIVDIVDEIEQNGSYIEPSSDGSLDAAIEDAREAGVAFVWLNQAGGELEATELAEDIWNALDARSSRYRIVLVLVENGYNAYGPVDLSATTLNDALDGALPGFSTGAIGNGLDAFTSTLTAASAGSGSTTATTTGESTGSTGGSSGGFSLSTLLLPLIAAGGGFWFFRNWSRKRKEDKAADADMEADRAEIKEQLRDNADRVIELGDRVVLSDDRELMDTYEKASRTYQDVSQGVDGASTAGEVDELDDRIDQAEWQLEMIEAKLDGRPVPPSPAEIEAEETRAAQEEADAKAAQKRANNEKPALGRDESVIRPRTQQRSSYPTGRMPGGYGRRRRGMGGGLGGILGSIVLGQMQRQQRSRRSQQRGSSFPGGFGGSSSGGRAGGLGGGVLQRGGSGGRSGSGRRAGSRGRKGSGRSF